MALPKEPRQKMINIMYLVLTAILALNVSAEILNAFKVVDSSLGKSNAALEESNKLYFQSFADQLKKAETAEKARESKSRINTWVAISVALVATFMGICKVKDDNIVQAMQASQVERGARVLQSLAVA